MAKHERPGKKHRILFISQSINRIWRNLLLIDIILWIVWWFAPYGNPIFAPPNDIYIMYAGVVVLLLMLFFFLIRKWGYVQAKAKHVLVVVPFFRLRIPYKHIESVRMTEFKKLFKYRGLSWANKRFLRPYFRKTVATLHLNGYPLPYSLIRFFLPTHMILPRDTGFIFPIKDFLKFNTEVDSRLTIQRDQGYYPFEDSPGIIELLED